MIGSRVEFLLRNEVRKVARRWVMHVDMDAFYAAVEQRDNPELKGKPVIVGGLSSRGVVATASYEAREFGVRSAMPITEAKRRCPHGIFVTPNPERYWAASQKVQKIFSEFSPLVEMLSVDEGFMDISGMGSLYSSVSEIPRLLKQKIFEETQLVASAGVGPNKFVAKIASDIGKPNGLVIVPHDRVLDFLAPLPLERIWGVGGKTAEKLHHMGFQTIGDIRQKELSFFQPHFGSLALRLYELSRGIDHRPVVPDEERKSLGKETTYESDLMSADEIRAEISRIAQQVGWRLRREGWMGWTVTLKVRYSPFRTISRSHTMQDPISLDEEITEAALELFENLDEKSNVRLLGVTIDNLEPYEEQVSLFNNKEELKKRNQAIDQLKKRFGEGIIGRGSSFAGKEKVEPGKGTSRYLSSGKDYEESE